MTEDEAELLTDLLDLDSGFTEWEIDFLESLDRIRGRVLTDKQAVMLHDIARKVGLED